MKKILSYAILLLCICTPISADTVNSSTLEPRASYVFSEVASSIAPSAYGGDFTLTATGDATITIILQKKLTSNNSWMPVDGATGTKSFSDTRIGTYSKNKSLSSGTYRCKTYVTAKVGSYSDERTVYSPELKLN